MLFHSDTTAPLNSRLPIPKTVSSLLPRLSFRGIADGAAGSPRIENGVGPVLARIQSDPTFYRLASTDAKVRVERAVAEEKLQTNFSE